MAANLLGVASQSSATTHDINDIVMYNGKEAQITRILGNDKFEIAYPPSNVPTYTRTQRTVSGFQIQV